MSGPHDHEPQQPDPPEADELDDLIWLQDTRQDRLDDFRDDQP
ncbi:hypothetical protein OG596_26210 [Streptomyces sp. NBC_01102]|nr:hypothetical protein OG596_26210 [Streptomyces sp. NBC_01102]